MRRILDFPGFRLSLFCVFTFFCCVVFSRLQVSSPLLFEFRALVMLLSGRWRRWRWHESKQLPPHRQKCSEFSSSRRNFPLWGRKFFLLTHHRTTVADTRAQAKRFFLPFHAFSLIHFHASAHFSTWNFTWLRREGWKLFSPNPKKFPRYRRRVQKVFIASQWLPPTETHNSTIRVQRRLKFSLWKLLFFRDSFTSCFFVCGFCHARSCWASLKWVQQCNSASAGWREMWTRAKENFCTFSPLVAVATSKKAALTPQKNELLKSVFLLTNCHRFASVPWAILTRFRAKSQWTTSEQIS